MADVIEAEEDVDVALAVVDDALEVCSFYPQILYEGLTDLHKDDVVVKTVGDISLSHASPDRQ